MIRVRWAALVALAALSGAAAPEALAAPPQSPSADAYAIGLDMIGAGNLEGALAFWTGLRADPSSEAAEDPRIGTAFIGAVTENELERYEEIATVMFYWGFSGTVTEATRDEILAEGRRTFGLVDVAAVEYWDEVGRDDPGALALAIKQFWIERDPTPATLVNERLVEHWKRIAHARQAYVYNRSSAYRTDDRGTFHIKYGQPDRITRGHLRVSESERRFRNLPIDYIARFDQQPQYEIWRYATMHPGEFTYFLFGNTQGTGPFRQVQGLHEILPASARVSGEARYAGIRAQHYLELFYYEDLARMGGPYGLRFAELERLWNAARTPAEGTLEAVSRRHVADDQWAARQPLPRAISEFDTRPRSALSAQTVRILEGGEPRLLVMAVSSPIWLPATETDSIRGGLTLAAYTASHTVILRNARLSEMGRAGMLPVDGPGALSTLLLRHADGIRHVSVEARHDVQEEQDSIADTAGRLPGHLHFVVGEPLAPVSAEPGAAAFEVSDLVVGIAPRPELDLGELPVPLLPATRFWRDDPLRVYFEIYRAGAVDLGTVDVRVHLTPITDAIPSIPPPDAEDLDMTTAGITLSVDSPSDQGEHFFDLDLRNERAGLLRVVVRVTDRETGATRIRAAPIQLLQN